MSITNYVPKLRKDQLAIVFFERVDESGYYDSTVVEDWELVDDFLEKNNIDISQFKRSKDDPRTLQGSDIELTIIVVDKTQKDYLYRFPHDKNNA